MISVLAQEMREAVAFGDRQPREATLRWVLWSCHLGAIGEQPRAEGWAQEGQRNRTSECMAQSRSPPIKEQRMRG